MTGESQKNSPRLTHIRRRTLVSLLGGFILLLVASAAGCGGDSEEEEVQRPEQAALPTSCGEYEIPQVDVALGMGPFGDNSIPVIGINAGWYEDVGITITPEPHGRVTLNEEIVPQLLNEQIDIGTQWTPSQVQLLERAPNVKMIGFSDTYIGLYLLASPSSGAKSLADLMAEGMPFDEAMKTTVGQMRGKRLGVDNTGAHQVFLNTITELGDLSFDELELTTIDDTRLVQLGRGGQIDFAKPAGGPQNVQLLQDGWFPIISIEEVIANLPPGDPRAVGAIGHTGPASTQEYWDNERDTVLRFMSVMFRTADEWKRDPEETLALELDYLTSVTGAEVGLDGLVAVFDELNPLITFEEQADYWINADSPFHYTAVYNHQIKELQEGGVLSTGSDLDASQVIIGDQVYQALLDLKEQYEELEPMAADISGDCADLVDQAAVHYDNRNYLDAARMLETASQVTEGS